MWGDSLLSMSSPRRFFFLSTTSLLPFSDEALSFLQLFVFSKTLPLPLSQGDSLPSAGLPLCVEEHSFRACVPFPPLFYDTTPLCKWTPAHSFFVCGAFLPIANTRSFRAQISPGVSIFFSLSPCGWISMSILRKRCFPPLGFPFPLFLAGHIG